MKRELTLTDIAGYLPYGLKIQGDDQDIWTIRQLGNVDPCRDGDVGLISDDGHYEQYDYIDDIKPVLRPMSDLYAEITERGYNDGKPFIPIFRMAKIKYPEFTRFTHCNLDTGTVFVSSPDSPITGWYEYDEEGLSIGDTTYYTACTSTTAA
jgi:hypothetical protein